MMETVCLIFMFRTRPDTLTVDGMIIPHEKAGQ
jgi:hypothetical protein